MNGIIYARVSSVGQLSGHGVERQIKCCLDYANKNNIKVLSILTECCSGSDPSKMLVRNFAVELSKAKSTSRTPCKILVEDRERWSRSGLSDPLLHYKIILCSENEIIIQKAVEKILFDYSIKSISS